MLINYTLKVGLGNFVFKTYFKNFSLILPQRNYLEIIKFLSSQGSQLPRDAMNSWWSAAAKICFRKLWNSEAKWTLTKNLSLPELSENWWSQLFFGSALNRNSACSVDPKMFQNYIRKAAVSALSDSIRKNKGYP